jgi:hypothetical protein
VAPWPEAKFAIWRITKKEIQSFEAARTQFGSFSQYRFTCFSPITEKQNWRSSGAELDSQGV